MSDIIHLLPEHIANQIAAGEVVQRPASVVKELMENSVDAGATRIEVNIKDAGRTLIQVIDNGKGMSETDARMAFERHATSKITTIEDLFKLRTMGFRGEALASIAAVAQVELKTKLKDATMGISLSISGSVLESVTPEACNEGSIISVKNLFYNVPARRKFLKTNETEFRNILTEFERVVLVHTDIAFVLRHNDSVVFDLPSGILRQRIIDVCGKGMNQKLLPVSAETSLAKISGFVGQLDSVRKRGSLQYFFVNGRYMRHPYFHKAVMQAYENMIPTGESPDYFIYFELDPSTIDVNIHPTKTEIKFENERPLWSILCSSVREAIAKSNSVPIIDFDTTNKIDIPVYSENASVQKPQINVNPTYNPFNEIHSKRPTDNWQALYESFESDKSSLPLPDKEIVPQSVENSSDDFIFENVSNPCFQYKNKYIITALKSGLVIIDQHCAHIRILYERYLKNIQNRKSVSQKLLFPEIVEFTTTESTAIASMADEIKSLGFDMANMGGNSYAIHAVPTDVQGDYAKLVKDVIAAALEEGGKESEKRVEKMAMSLAKSSAIPYGKALTVEEMDSLVASLFVIEANGTTPDGRKIITTLSDDELAKRL